MHGKVRCGSDCKLTITDHSAVSCIYTRWAVHVLHDLRDIHTVLAIHQPHNLACQRPKCVVLNGKYPFKTRKTYFTSFCLLKCLWNIVTWLMYRTAPPPLTETVSWRSFVELQTRHEPCEVRVRWPPPIFVLSWSSGHWHFCLHFPAVMQFYIDYTDTKMEEMVHSV